MSNTFYSAKQIAREALPRLMDNLVFPNLIYKDAGENLTAKRGDTVVIHRPVQLSANTFTDGESIAPQSIVEDTVEVTLDTLATVDVEVSALESACSFDDMTRLFLEPAAAALAQKINNDGLKLYATVSNVAGTPGKAPADLGDFAEAVYALDKAGVPSDGRCAVWSPRTACQLKQIPALVHADQCGSSKALRTGSIGKVFGLENYMSQAVRSHTAGTLSGTASGITVAAVDGNSITLNVTSGDGKTIAAGDVLVITEGDDAVFCTAVETDAVVSGSAVTITAAAEPDTDIIGCSVQVQPSHEANLVFHPYAFAFVTRPLAAPAGVESYVTSYNGVSLRVVRGYDINRKKDILSMDVLYGFKAIYPELAVRYMG